MWIIATIKPLKTHLKSDFNESLLFLKQLSPLHMYNLGMENNTVDAACMGSNFTRFTSPKIIFYTFVCKLFISLLFSLLGLIDPLSNLNCRNKSNDYNNDKNNDNDKSKQH